MMKKVKESNIGIKMSFWELDCTNCKYAHLADCDVNAIANFALN